MSVFKFFKTNSPSLKQGLELDFSKDFADQDCRCVQQELDLSELTWMDASSYKQTKETLKTGSINSLKARLASNDQHDLFG